MCQYNNKRSYTFNKGSPSLIYPYIHSPILLKLQRCQTLPALLLAFDLLLLPQAPVPTTLLMPARPSSWPVEKYDKQVRGKNANE